MAQTAVLLVDDDPLVLESLGLSLGDEGYAVTIPGPAQPHGQKGIVPGKRAGCTLSELEVRHIQGVLQQTGWNIQRAAEVLGIHRNTLARKIDEYGLRGAPE